MSLLSNLSFAGQHFPQPGLRHLLVWAPGTAVQPLLKLAELNLVHGFGLFHGNPEQRAGANVDIKQPSPAKLCHGEYSSLIERGGRHLDGVREALR